MWSRLGWAAAFGLAVAAGVALGAVPTQRLPMDQPVYVDGALTYTWHGDPARGCQRQNLCGQRGSIIVRFAGYGDLVTRSKGGLATLQGAAGTARVRRDDPGAQPGVCSDVITTLGLPISIVRTAGRRYIATLQASGISSGRCAGPVAGDLASLRLPARRLHTHRIGFDLGGATRFARGPYSGQLSSTLELYPDTSDEGSFGGTTTAGETPVSNPSRVELREFVRLRYRISGGPGALRDVFVAGPPPACVTSDTCGLTGSVTITLRSYRDTVTIDATRVVRRRIGARGALRDFEAGRLEPNVSDLRDARLGVSEVVQRIGAATCRDMVPLSATADLEVFTGPGHFAFFALEGPLFGGDPLRTHCPGPTETDALGDQADLPLNAPPLAAHTLSLRTLAEQRRLVMPLGAHGSFNSGVYSNTRSGGLTFTLTRLARRAGTERLRVGG